MGGTSIVPVGDLLRQLVLAVGAALALGNLAVIVRERRRKPEDKRPRPNMKIVYLNLAIGTFIAVSGVASMIVASRS